MNIKNFFNHWIVRNLLLAVLFVAVLVLVFSVSLNRCTRHNNEIKVPDFSMMSSQDAIALASQCQLRAIVTDSVYVRKMTPGAVYMQNPAAGSMVKKGRKIRLTINTVVPQETYLPPLVGCSLRQAKAELKRSGLVLGKLIYVKDIATNYVLKAQRYGVEVKAGTPMSSGTVIDLVLGLSNDTAAIVPDLRGKSLRTAVDMAQDNSLNVGRLRYDQSVKSQADSSAAFVYSQKPEPSAASVLKGDEITLYLTLDESKLNGGK